MLRNDFFLKRGGHLSFVFLLILFFLISCIFILSSCSYTPHIIDVNYYEGIRGLEMEFLVDSPPDELYEDSPFNINLFVENRGAFDVIGEHYGVVSISFDPFYIDVSGLEDISEIDLSSNGIVFKGVQLPGKSRYYPGGTETIMSFPNFRTKEIVGQREEPSTQIFTSLCYPYTTQFAKLVCIDLNIYGQNLRKQVCSQQDLSLSDQGAPLAITLIEIENQPVGGDAVRPVFTIYVQNKGSGNVLSPAYNAVELERVCSFTDLNKEDFNTVEVRSILSHSKELDCEPNPIRLFNGQGFTRCSVRDEDLVLGHQNYETPLAVNLSYVYLTSVSEKIEIKRLNIYGGSTSPLDQCLPSEVPVGDHCISRCLYCAQHPGDGSCQPVSSKFHIDFQEGFNCQCSSKSCNELYPKGLCVPFGGYCPGASYCCLPECRFGEVLINGECYPKCSSSDCAKASKDCACGTEELGYVVIAENIFCCPELKQGYTDETSCEQACSPPDE